jgi:hypothetical protein
MDQATINETLRAMGIAPPSPSSPQPHCALLQKDKGQEEIPNFEQANASEFPIQNAPGVERAELARGSVRPTDPSFAQARQNHAELIQMLNEAPAAGQPRQRNQVQKNTAMKQRFTDYIRGKEFQRLSGGPNPSQTVTSQSQVHFYNVTGDTSDEDARKCDQATGNPAPGQAQPSPNAQPPPFQPPNPGGPGGPGGAGGLLQSLLPALIQSLMGQKQGGQQGGGQQPPYVPPRPTPTPVPHGNESIVGLGEQIEGFIRNGIPKALIEQVVLSVLNLFFSTLSGQIPVTTVPAPETVVGI